MELATDLHASTRSTDKGVELRLTLPARSALVSTTCKLAALVATHGQDANAPKITLVLRELLSNAIEHGSEGNPSRAIDVVVARQENGEIELVVSDEGHGFPAGTLDLSSAESPNSSLRSGLRFANAVCKSMTFEKGGSRIVCRIAEDIVSPIDH